MERNDILNINFEKAAFGYRAEDVGAHLERVVAYVDSLQEEKATLEQKMALLAQKVEEYREDEANMKEALIGAQRLGRQVVNEANAQAEATINEANAQAEATINEANARAEATINEANSLSENLIRDAQQKLEKETRMLSLQVATEEANLTKMQKEVSDFKSQLLSTYKAHLDIITALPEVDEEVFEEASEEEPQVEENYESEDYTLEEYPEQEYEPAAEAVQETVEGEAYDEFLTTSEDNQNFDSSFETFESRFGELKFGNNLERE